MKKNQTIETQLDCHAVASLQEQINSDLSYEDKSLASLLNDDDKDKDTDEPAKSSN